MSEQQLPHDAASTANSTDSASKQLAAAVLSDTTNSQKIVWTQPVYLMLGAVTVLLGVHWWTSQTQISSLREELALRLQRAETNSSETKLLAKTVYDGSKEIQAKVAVLEGKQSEAQSQQLALEQLYQDLSKNRDEWALAEIEQVLATASQQLQLAGNVQGAIIALQNADSRLAKSEKPQF
ncbi:MAG: uroporphyrinogen-III C-methyltransferase, partial [Burkholderiales bacterium]|nr:uroporphyrinogen-III C-methyltransferase [Burkholderiales bacterium]